MMIYIILTGFNNKQHIQNSIIQLNKQTYKNFKVIYVDDKSTDGTVEMLEAKYKKITIIQGNGNLWWAGANKLGIKYALSYATNDDYILLLNNYLTFNENYLNNIMEISNKFPSSIISPVVYDKLGKIVDAGVIVKRIKNFPRINILKEIKLNRNYIKSDLTTGRAVLFPVKLIKKIGNIHTFPLKHYGSDYLYTNRYRKKGYDIIVHYSLKVIINKDRKILSEEYKNKNWWGRNILNNSLKRNAGNIIIQYLFIFILSPGLYKVLNVAKRFYWGFLKKIKINNDQDVH